MVDPVPHDIRLLADERSRARRSRDWATADRLKAELEAAGWRVVDAASLYTLERLPSAVVEVDGEVRYGTNEAVPSRLDEQAAPGTTVVLEASDRVGAIPRTVEAVLAGSPTAQVVVVANDPVQAVAAELEALSALVEVVRLAPRVGLAAAWNAGVRRAGREVVVLLDAGVDPGQELIAALAAALDDPQVAVAGPIGLVTDDLVHFEPAPSGQRDVAAIDGLALAFRRADYAVRGPIDEHFALPDFLDAWWSLMLRDVPDDAGVDAIPGRAVVVPVALGVHGTPRMASDERRARKQRYRYLKYFASRRDLLVGPSE